MCLLAFCTEEILANRLMISSRLHGIVEKDHTQYVTFMRPGRYSLEMQEMIHQPDRRRWLMLIIVLSAALVVVLDAFIVNVAIPSIQRSLHASFAELQLVVAGYTLAFAVLLVTGGRMGDLYGRKRVFVLGMGLLSALLLPKTLEEVAPHDAGAASGVYTTASEIAGALGVALIGLLDASLTASSGNPLRAFIISILAIVLLSSGLSLSVLPLAGSRSPTTENEALTPKQELAHEPEEGMEQVHLKEEGACLSCQNA